MAVKRFVAGPPVGRDGCSLDADDAWVKPANFGELPLAAPNPALSLYPRPAPPTAIDLPFPLLKRDFRNHELCIANSNNA